MSLEISPTLPKSSQEPRELCNMSLDKMRISSESSSISNGKGFTRSDTSSQNWAKFEPVYFKDLLPVQEDLNSKKRISTTKKSEDKDISAEIVDAHDKTSDFLRCLVELLLDYMKRSNDRSTKVLDFHHPHTMKEILGHCLEVQHEPQTIEQILSDCKETLKYCVKTGFNVRFLIKEMMSGTSPQHKKNSSNKSPIACKKSSHATAHPRFFNQISTGMDSVCLAGEWLTAAVNTNMFTYEIAPVFTLMENVILRKMRSIVGWDNGDGDGLFAPGGAISNLYAAIVARHKFIPEAKTQGLYGMPRLVMFTSEQTAGSVLGIGTDNVILVKSDSRGRMIPRCLDEEIEKAKAAGSVPFFVSATEGTTVLGAFDPLNEIADICERHGIWFHVDAAWGGGLLLTEKYKRIFAGVERADSVTWNPHKLMGAHLQCSVILFKQKGLLEGCNCTQASYLFQQDKQYDIQYDTGDKAIQCGRHNDIFKLWLMWRSKGDTGFEKQINRLMDLSKYLQKKLSGREGYEFVLENPEFLNVCFWYIPKCMRHMPPGLARDEMLDKVAPRIKAKMMEKGSTMVGYQPLGSKPNFFRMIISNPATNLEDIDFLVEEIETLGEEIVI